MDGWPCEHVAVCVTGAVEATRGDESRALRVGVGDEARLCGRDARRRGGGDRRPRRAGRAARRDLPPPALAQLGAAVRGRRADRGAGQAAHLLELRLRGRGRARRGAGGDAVRDVLRARVAGTTLQLRGSAGSGASGTLADLRALAHELQRAGAGRRRDARRGGDGAVPGARRRRAGVRAAGRRTTGASASSCATASRRTGRAPATAPGTFGHFGRSGTFLWVDPVAGIALGASPTVRSATGRSTRGRASPMRCWPKQPCPGSDPGTRLDACPGVDPGHG